MDEETVKARLFELRYMVAQGDVSDWEDPWFTDDILLCDQSFHRSNYLHNWQDELAEILVDKVVESCFVYDHTDSVGDRWVRFFPPKAA